MKRIIYSYFMGSHQRLTLWFDSAFAAKAHIEEAAHSDKPDSLETRRHAVNRAG